MNSAPASCNVPGRLTAEETNIYEMLRRAHCARKLDAHDCQGRLTIDKNGITASCPRCGDSRSVNAEAKS